MAPREPAGDIEVLREVFDRDPLRYMRQATPDRRVIVHHATGRLSAVFGGSLDYLPDGTPGDSQAKRG